MNSKNRIIATTLIFTAGYLHTSNPHSKKPPLHTSTQAAAPLIIGIQKNESVLAALIASLPADSPGKKKLLEEFASRSGNAYATYEALQKQIPKTSPK